MFNELISLLSMPIMQRAVIGGLFISLCAALLGVSLVLKRYSMIGDGLSHVGFGAVAVATVMNASPMVVAIPVVVICAFLLLRISESNKIKGDSAIAIVSTGSLAIGVIAVSVKSGINTDFNSYMFGTILGMTKSDVILSLAITIPVIILYLLFYHKIFAVTFDEAFSSATGIKVSIYNSLIAVLTALTIVLGMRLMGALLISSLIIFPALSAMRVCKHFGTVIICSACVSVFCFLFGIILSCLFNLPTGASIVCTNIFAFLLMSVLGKVRR